MIRSDAGRFAFVHIQKTAGNSVADILEAHFSDCEMSWHGRHGFALRGIEEIGREAWDRLLTFAFVRNPWDRLVSHYSMIMAYKARLSAEQLASEKPFKIELWNDVLRNSNDFESFLYRCTDIIDDRGTLKSFSFNQLDYIADDTGNLAVTWVGRFENLEHDAGRIFEHLGLRGVQLPHVNASAHQHYSEYYNRETRDLVAERFARDIEAFGYRFESSAT